MKRRDFLNSLPWAGYSLMVLADDLPAAPGSLEASGDEIRATIKQLAPPDGARQPAKAEPNMTQVDLECDLLVAGGGLAGVLAAVSAARHGARVVLVQDRSRLGGNSSSEVKMHVVGANHHKGRPGWREGGLLEEFRLEDAVNNPQRTWELWDLLLYDKLVSEPRAKVLLDTSIYAVEKTGDKITAAWCRCDKTEHLYRVTAKLYMDCTGDSRLGLEAGAELRYGRESRSEFNEPLAPETPDKETMGSSILFTSRKFDRPMPFKPPHWARKVEKQHLVKRSVKSWEYGYWWIEWGGQLNTINDNERIRFELLSIVLGVWDYIKNSGNHPDSANWALDWVGMIPGKRESRRLMGEHVLTQFDLVNAGSGLDDAVCIGGWPMDDHPPGGFDRADLPPTVMVKTPIFNIPLRSLYSKNVSNLMMAGRNISATHAAFTSTRVMATCAVIGQAAGTAAALCIANNILPKELYQDKKRLAELQQTLLRDDQSIAGLKNDDAADLARTAKVTASGETEDAPAKNVINGFVRDVPGQYVNRWSTELGEGAWLELDWDKPAQVGEVQVTFDSGFQRELTLSSQDGVNHGIIRAPQPETVRDYTLEYRDSASGDWKPLAAVTGNYQRLVRHRFDPVTAQAIRLKITATNGDRLARVFEVRCYG
ncbi:MAG: FAD-dependent oxidoreductase [Planctomycetes bacterium]|nr:FAD-dependent oxidoreductase [Planctomycetota bacterium]